MKENKTTYAYLIEHMQNPSFQKVWDFAYDFVHKLPSELCDELHKDLNRGIDELESEPLLQMYIYAFGKMHNAKLQYAFNQMHDRIIKNDKIEIVDYGCGQGLATICYHDFIKEHNSTQHISKIILIEPSQLALARAELLCSRFFPESEIVAVNKYFDDLTPEDINISSNVLTLHLFSNILDVESYNLHHLIQTVKKLPSAMNEYIIVSPIQNSLKTQRLKTFVSNLNGYIYYENLLDKGQLNKEKDWTCAVFLCTSILEKELVEYDYDKVFNDVCSFFDSEDKKKKNEYSKILFHRLHHCAEQGDRRCQNLLGLWYLDGITTEPNCQLAIEWLKKSAEQKYDAALFNLGNMYYDGNGVDQDYHKAIEYYTIGADDNYPYCQFELGTCFFNGTGIEKNLETAFLLFKRAAEQGHEEATYYLWICYINGYGVKKDEKLAIHYLKRAVKLKNSEACFHLATVYQSGKLVEKDEKKAFNLFKKSAKLGNDLAQNRMGEIFKNGELGIKKSPKESFNWYLKAAEQGRSSAQFYIGYFYANGYGVKSDAILAFDWYLKAAKQNNAAALNNLAVCYEYGEGTKIDLGKAAYYYEESAKLGNIKAQKNTAKCYKNGTGVESSPSKVFYWTMEAAKNGDIDSLGKIAFYLFKGYGTKKSHTEALLWYARYWFQDIHVPNPSLAFQFFHEKANLGDPQALYIIGKCLQYGIIEEKSIEDSYSYFEKAAELGHIESLIKVHHTSSLFDYCSFKEDDSAYKDAYGAKYSKDRKILINSGYQKREEYQIASGTRIICNNAFSSGNVGKIIIPSSIIAIGFNPFAESGWGRCTVRNVECHSDQYVVSEFALYTKDKKKLISYFGNSSKVTIPDGVEIIGKYAFVEDSDLYEISFPDSLCCIEDEAFKYCLNLRRISLPKNVSQIGEKCFYGCESLEEIMSLGKVEKICKEAFCGCNIKKLILPESVVEIDDNAFNSNNNLESVTLPNHVKRIGNSCFAYCSIKKIYLDEDLQEIGDFCFFECPIESLAIPSNVILLGLNPFVGTKAIECVENLKYISENGLLFDNKSGTLISYYGETEVALYPPISCVNSFAFYNSTVTDIFIGNNLIEVAPWAFYKAHKLEHVIWRRSKVTEIPIGCFGECSKIHKIDIPLGVKIVQKGALFNCYDLRIIHFHGLTRANEEIFRRINQPSVIPFTYRPRHRLMGITLPDLITKEIIDPETFPQIEVIIPQGYAKYYSFSPIHDQYWGLGMDRKFIIKENEKEYTSSNNGN